MNNTELINELRDTMPEDVLRAWAKDAKAALVAAEVDAIKKRESIPLTMRWFNEFLDHHGSPKTVEVGVDPITGLIFDIRVRDKADDSTESA